MANRLKVTARNWAAQVVACRFTATADGKPLPTAAPTKLGWQDPAGHNQGGSDGDAGGKVFGLLADDHHPLGLGRRRHLPQTPLGLDRRRHLPPTQRPRGGDPGRRCHPGEIKMSRFKEVTAQALGLLQDNPASAVVRSAPRERAQRDLRGLATDRLERASRA